MEDEFLTRLISEDDDFEDTNWADDADGDTDSDDDEDGDDDVAADDDDTPKIEEEEE